MKTQDFTSNMSLPLVSIIISAYNAEKYIAATLDSVLEQTWSNIEIIVVNDGSTDTTSDALQLYKNRGVQVIQQENKGQDAALNNGYMHCKGSYIKFMDSDDLINKEMIALQMNALNGSEEHIAYGEWARFYNDQPKHADFTPLDYWKDMEPLDFLTAKASGVMLQCGIMLVPRKIIEKGGLWDERLILFNDTEFFTRLLLASRGVKFSAGARLYYRSGQIQSISSGRQRRHYESTYLATKLIAEHLLAVEDSIRIRKLISNTFFMQYYQMYPKHPDLIKKYEEEINKHGHGDYIADGGRLFKMLKYFFGWKTAKKIQSFIYDMGYFKLIYKMKEVKNK